MLSAFMHGFLLAIGLILPLGAQNVFVFTQGATQQRFSRALPVVFTAAICDTILILLAVLGVSLVVLTVTWLKTLLFAIGIFFLLYMGWLTWKSKPETGSSQQAERFSPKKQMMFAASVSLLNPHAILDTVGVIGTSSLVYAGGEKWSYTIACILVSCVWFFALALAGRMVGQLDRSGRLLRILNRLSALIMWGVAVYMAVSLYHTLS
ncbi:LysE/ArgO family amino acid transporter [Brevibacillus fulvus]|uniref:L-lysine exporter family protein LysE/ArgO n=1 Tax=Brevibacillus fulvus TaxID=1125967 RepID=A0A938Y290_9BACL|nr:LysE/ArgO family amino acid transporter [Brevibacillus fulvus]MBM7591059.1 L-lysine exporter family protein LysE/ArgO [Brevibacillus fulvus]